MRCTRGSLFALCGARLLKTAQPAPLLLAEALAVQGWTDMTSTSVRGGGLCTVGGYAVGADECWW